MSDVGVCPQCREVLLSVRETEAGLMLACDECLYVEWMNEPPSDPDALRDMPGWSTDDPKPQTF
ncbi:hypothetical protein [Microbacterium sp. GXF6406]